MEDTSWRLARDTWERVKWARERYFPSAAKAAERLGMPESTYRQYERAPGTSRWATLDEEYAKAFSRTFRVNWVWLLTGTGTPYAPQDDQLEDLMGVYAALDQSQKQLLLDLARNLVASRGNVVSVDTLPAQPRPAGQHRRTQHKAS